MKIEINLYATLSRYMPAHLKKSGRILDVEEGITLNQLMEQLNIPAKQVKLVFLDGVRADGESVLKEGSRVGVFPPVGGG